MGCELNGAKISWSWGIPQPQRQLFRQLDRLRNYIVNLVVNCNESSKPRGTGVVYDKVYVLVWLGVVPDKVYGIVGENAYLSAIAAATTHLNETLNDFDTPLAMSVTLTFQSPVASFSANGILTTALPSGEITGR